MNAIFAEHVTNTAFFLSISKKQIRYLDVLHNSPWPDRAYYDRTIQAPDNWIASYKSLIAKGLVVRVIDDPVREVGHYELTQVGRLTCALLVEAGLIQEGVCQRSMS